MTVGYVLLGETQMDLTINISEPIMIVIALAAVAIATIRKF